MKEHISWRPLPVDSVNGYGLRVTYTFTSFDPDEIAKMEKWCKQFIKEGIIVDGVRAHDIDESENEFKASVIINGVKYIAEKPMVKTVDKFGEVVISGFREEK